MPNTGHSKYLFLTGSITIILYLCALSDQYKPTPDSSEYVGTAQSLVEGRGLQFNNIPGSKYPPLISLVTAAVTKITGQNQVPVLAMKIVQIVLAIFLAVGTWRWAGKFISEGLAKLLGIMILANITVFQHTMYILSDMLYTCLSIWALLLLEKVGRSGKGKWIAGILLAAAAWMTRSVGLTLAAAVFLWLLTSPRKKPAWKKYSIAIITPILIAIPWLCWKMAFPTDELSYTEYWMEITGQKTLLGIMINRMSNMIPILLMRTTQIVLNIESKPFNWLILIPTLLVILTGFVRSWQKGSKLLSWYTLCYMGIMSLWFDQGTRFLLPMLPVLLIYAALGLEWFSQGVSTLSKRTGTIVITLFIFVIFLPVWTIIGRTNQVSPMEMIRNGTLYSLLAGGILVWILINRFVIIPPIKIERMTIKGIVILYIVIQWGYLTGYALLEHRLVQARTPMLMGYQPYYDMGEWLKDFPQIPSPILCRNASVVHLSSGQITCHSKFTSEKNFEMFESGQAKGVLLQREPEVVNPDTNSMDDPALGQIRKMIDEHPNHFKCIDFSDRVPLYIAYEYIPIAN